MRLSVCDIECYAFHGCMEEEGKIGQRFSVDVIIDFDFPDARAIKVLLTKYNPPVNGRIGKAVVEVRYTRN